MNVKSNQNTDVGQPSPDDLLSAWYCLEMFNPQALKRNPPYVAITESEPGPWLLSGSGTQASDEPKCWRVVLGELDLRKTSDRILVAFPDQDAEE